MKIDPTAVAPAFQKPAATFDRPSRSFGDFLGNASARGDESADRASRFGAKGLFGTATSWSSKSPSGPLPVTAPLGDLAARTDLTLTGNLDGGADPTNDTPYDAAQPAAPGEAPEPSAKAPLQAANSDGTEGTSEFNLTSSADGPVWTRPGLAVDDDSPVDRGPEKPPAAATRIQANLRVVLCGDAADVNVLAASSPLNSSDRARLHRLMSSVLAEHGKRLDQLSHNGEPIQAATFGETDGRFPG